MTKAYLINETLLFEPEMRRLGPLAGYPDRSIALHSPVSECLHQLLENNHQILTQRFLFAAIWEKQGAVVTTNALYQTIASVRKALKAAGLEDDVIKTFPKEGFKCIAELRVGTREDFLMPQDPPAITSETEISAEPAGGIAAPRGVTQKAVFAYWLAGGMFILSCGVFLHTLNNATAVFDRYHKVGNIGGCQVFSSWQDNEKSRSMFKTLSNRYPIPCQKGMFAYLSLDHPQQGIAVITCNRNPKVNAAKCGSIFYRQQYDK